MKIGIYYKPDKKSKVAYNIIVEQLQNFSLFQDDTHPDVVIFVGGDGTFLKAVHHYIHDLYKISFVGVHTGSLGFFTSYSVDEISLLLTTIKNNKFISKKHSLLEAEISDSKGKEVIYAVNEIRIENAHHTVISSVNVGDQFLEDFRGNGLLVSSHLGSSGYNKSIGGALIEEDLDVLQLTEIAPISNAIYRPLSSPLIISGRKKITFSGSIGKTIVGYDYLTRKLNGKKYNIVVGLSNKSVTLCGRSDYNYYHKLRKTFTKI